MRRGLISLCLLTLFVIWMPGNARSQPLTKEAGRLQVEPVVTFQAAPFPLENVRLLDGPFKEAMERDARYLLDLEPDRFLHNFRKLAGLEPKAPLYGGWESQQIAGHSLGHYLTALSMYYAESGDPQFLERINYIVDELAEAQKANGDGYVAAIPGAREAWTEIARGEVRGEPFNLNGVWVPWYTLHKLFAGLIDAYRYTGSEKALQVVTNLADWAYETTKNLSASQWQEMLATEHGGMNEALADLYAITGETRYLTLSRHFHHQKVLGPLARQEPDLEGKHANTQIPKVIGAIRLYELLQADSLWTIAHFFWNQVVGQHTYAIGGNSQDEHFGPPGQLANRLKNTTAETCNTYNMLRLTRHLFAVTGEPQYADFYEQALYNHILASQEPEKGMVTYFMSLKPGHFKTYSTPDSSFWCCVGSGMENHVRYGEGIYFHNDTDVIVNLFIPSSLSWPEKGLTLRQETSFPEHNVTRFVITPEQPVEFGLKIRHPEWAEGTLSVRINGESTEISSSPGDYATLRRTWSPGDVVEVEFPMHLHLKPMPDDPNRIAILYGPIVLAGALGTENMPDSGAFANDHRQYLDLPAPQVPVLAAEAGHISEWVKPVESKPLTFQTVGVGRPNDVTLIPFYKMHHQRYNVYWDLVESN